MPSLVGSEMCIRDSLVAGRCDVVAPRPPRDAAPPREPRPPRHVRPPRDAEQDDVPPPELPRESELSPVPEEFPPTGEAGLTPPGGAIGE